MKTLPLITVAMAVYKPNLAYFKEQLESIEAQDYANIYLLIWNDSPEIFDCENTVSKYIHKVPYQIINNGKNNGVTQAFAYLTKAAKGKYIAYCDQDDIWLSNKITIMVQFLENNPQCTCCHSDVSFIDGKNTVIRQHIYTKMINKINDVNYQIRTFLVNNWNLGCAMVMPLAIAKAALPFPAMVFHDQWLEIFALSRGKFCYIPEVLIQHRVHGDNNSQTLRGIKNKSDYYHIKLKREVDFLESLKKRLPNYYPWKREGKWIEARYDYAEKHGKKEFFHLIKLMKVRPEVTIFELIIPFCSNGLFSKMLQLIRRNGLIPGKH